MAEVHSWCSAGYRENGIQGEFRRVHKKAVQAFALLYGWLSVAVVAARGVICNSGTQRPGYADPGSCPVQQAKRRVTPQISAAFGLCRPQLQFAE